MSNLPALSKVLQRDNPELFTTEGLSALLHDCICLKYAQNHRFTYPSLLDTSVYLGLAQLGNATTGEAEVIRRVSASIIWAKNGAETVQEATDFLFLSRKIRDNIHQIQKSLGISGVSQRNISIRDRLFSYPVAEDQLFTLESDRLAIQNAVPEIIRYFVNLVQMPSAYNLFLVDKDERKIPTAVATVQEAAARAVRAEIYTESHDWQVTGANCWQGNHAYKVDPDEIHLCLHLDWNENEFIFFDALHPDPTRWPWGVVTE
ncbi:MAG: hypothetical protein MET45_24115 [Nostoc sp. LLA-1]|nr:hypothetical protein [Cyanocohniella sp. LLY]